MGGLKKYMPITFATMITGWLAISGIPIFAGFFSKDEILWKTWSAGMFSLPDSAWSKALWAIGAITALLTAVYMTRMMVMTFWGPERFREKHTDHAADAHHADHAVHEPHESPWIMTVPLVILAVLSTVGGFIGVPYALGSFVSGHPVNYLEQTLEPVVSHVPAGASHSTEATPSHSEEAAPAAAATVHAHSPEEVRAERLLAALSVFIAALGIFIGWVTFQKRPLLQMPRILENKYYVDEIYDTTIIKPIHVFSREGMWKLFDVGVIDGFLHGLGGVVTESGRVIRYLQGGFVRSYAAIILAGALALIGFFAFYSVIR